METVVMVDVTDGEGFGWLKGAGWRVAVSGRLWSRYVDTPYGMERTSGVKRLDTLVFNLRTALHSHPDRPPLLGCGFRMSAHLNAPAEDADGRLTTIDVSVFPAIDHQRTPWLILGLAREHAGARPRRAARLN